jgi:hypothetical protein
VVAPYPEPFQFCHGPSRVLGEPQVSTFIDMEYFGHHCLGDQSHQYGTSKSVRDGITSLAAIRVPAHCLWHALTHGHTSSGPAVARITGGLGSITATSFPSSRTFPHAVHAVR